MKKLIFILSFIGNSIIAQNNFAKIDSLLLFAQSIENESPSKSQLEALKVLSLAKEVNYRKGIIEAEIFVSESYIRSKDNKKALYYATQSDKKISESSYYLKSKATRLRGISLGRLGFYQEGAKLLKRAIFYAEKIESANDRNRSLGFIYANIAINYDENEIQRDSVGYYYKKSFYLFNEIDAKDSNKNRCMAFANANLGSFYLKGRDLERAKSYFEKAAMLSKKQHLYFITIEAVSGLGSICYYQGNHKKAKDYFQEALSIATDREQIFYINDLYYNLFKTYENLRNPKQSKYFRNKYITLNDSLTKLHKEAMATSLRILLEDKDRKNANHLLLIILLLGVFLIIITFAYIFIRKYRKRVIRVKKESAIIDQQLKRKKELIEKLTDQKMNTQIETSELIQLAMEGSPSFYTKFKELYPESVAKVLEIAPTMVLSELRFYALIKLGFSTSEIATYTKSTVRAIESKRYRLRKKLNVPPEIDLYDWVKSL